MLIRPFIEFLNLRGNSMYALPDNGLKIEIFIYSLSTYSTTEPDFLLIQLSIIKIFLKNLEKFEKLKNSLF